MKTKPIHRVALAIAAAAALTMGIAVPATASPDRASEGPQLYPGETNWGIVHLDTTANGYMQSLQDTNEQYSGHSSAYDVVVSTNNIQHIKWYMISRGNELYRFVNFATGRALQGTLERRNPATSWLDFHVVTTPADWNNPYQLWRVTRNASDPDINAVTITNNGYYAGSRSSGDVTLSATAYGYDGYGLTNEVKVGNSGQFVSWRIPEAIINPLPKPPCTHTSCGQ